MTEYILRLGNLRGCFVSSDFSSRQQFQGVERRGFLVVVVAAAVAAVAVAVVVVAASTGYSTRRLCLRAFLTWLMVWKPRHVLSGNLHHAHLENSCKPQVRWYIDPKGLRHAGWCSEKVAASDWLPGKLDSIVPPAGITHGNLKLGIAGALSNLVSWEPGGIHPNQGAEGHSVAVRQTPNGVSLANETSLESVEGKHVFWVLFCFWVVLLYKKTTVTCIGCVFK